MHAFTREITVPATPHRVWDLVGRFDAIHRWHPDVPQPSLTGDPAAPGTRRVFGAGTQQEMTEELISVDDQARRMVYRLVDPAFPITGHTAEIVVHSADGGSRVTWTASFDATDEVAQQVEKAMGDGVFVPGLHGIAETFST